MFENGLQSTGIVFRRSTSLASFPILMKKKDSTRYLGMLALAMCLALFSCHHNEPHRVTLTWDPPHATADVTVVGYNVYRSTTSGGPFVKLASQVPSPPYEDKLVNSGRTYFYVVTAVERSGRESRFSAEVRAVIP